MLLIINVNLPTEVVAHGRELDEISSRQTNRRHTRNARKGRTLL